MSTDPFWDPSLMLLPRQDDATVSAEMAALDELGQRYVAHPRAGTRWSACEPYGR